MTQLVLSNYIKQGSASADSQKYVRVDSTQAIKKDVTFVRKAGIFNPKIGTFSVPEYRFTVRADTPNKDNLPSGQRLSTDLAIRLPVGATVEQLNEQLATLKELVNSAEFANSVVMQIFPCEVECPTAP